LSSRRRNTRSKRDWSSDVCSSDLHVPAARKAGVTQQRLDLLAAWRDLDGFTAAEKAALRLAETLTRLDDVDERTAATEAVAEHRSEERRVGKGCETACCRYVDMKR